MELMKNLETQMQNKKDCDLCVQVLKKLGPEKIKKSLKHELMQVNDELRESTERNFKNHIIYESVIKFLNSQVDTKQLNKGQTLLNPLYLNLVKSYTTTESKDGIQLFGINEEFIDSIIHGTQKTKLEKDELNKFVEEDINAFCDKLSEYAGNANRFRNNRQRAFQESVKELSNEIDRFSVVKTKIASDEIELDNLLLNYYENLLLGISLLKSLISLYEKKLDFESTLQKLYAARGHTLSSKVRRFELKIMSATYTRSSIKALKQIRDELECKKEILDNELNETNSELSSYHILGPAFDKIVEIYTNIVKKIEQESWTISSLKQRKSLDGLLSDEEKSKSLSPNETSIWSERDETRFTFEQDETIPLDRNETRHIFELEESMSILDKTSSSTVFDENDSSDTTTLLMKYVPSFLQMSSSPEKESESSDNVTVLSSDQEEDITSSGEVKPDNDTDITDLISKYLFV